MAYQIQRKKLVLIWNIDDALQDGYLHTRSFPLSLGDEEEFSLIKEKKRPIILIPSFSKDFVILGISREKYPGEINSISHGSKRKNLLLELKREKEFLKDRNFIGFSHLYRKILNLIKDSNRKNIRIRQGVKIKLYSTNYPLTYLLEVEDWGFKKWRDYRQQVKSSEGKIYFSQNLEKKDNKKIRASLLWSMEDLAKKINKKETPPIKVKEFSLRFIRDPYVVAYALKRSLGKCECCEKDAPFFKSNGDFYLEVHHLIPLSKGGLDSKENVVAICPNCHRMLHYGKLKKIKTQGLIEKFR